MKLVDTTCRRRITTVITDGWAGYKCFTENGYKHIIEIHEVGFKKMPNSTNPVNRL